MMKVEDNNPIFFPTNHSGSVNSLKFNSNGMKFATSGTDGKINIYSTDKMFSKENKEKFPDVVLIEGGHNKSINDISFSYPNYGNFLASCGYDKKLIIWKEKSLNNYQKIYEYMHESVVKCCKFSPYQYGLIVICGTEDGSINIHELERSTQKFKHYELKNIHPKGINSLDWAPASPPINLEEGEEEEEIENKKFDNEALEDILPMSFISCGNDCKINIFKAEKNIIESFVIENTIDLKEGNIPLDVAFLNFIGYTDLTFACGLKNGKCLIYKKLDKEWKNTSSINIGNSVVKVCWSLCGTYLGISSKKDGDDNDKVRFFRENMDDTWIEIQK